jgi:hypothetical protein
LQGKGHPLLIVRSNMVTTMKALKTVAAACVAAFALFAASPTVEAQGPPGRGGGYRGAPPPGGSYRGAPGGSYRGAPGGSYRGAPGGSYRGAPGAWRGGAPYYRGHRGYGHATTNFYFGYYGPGYWGGPGYWPRYWWGWGPGYWGPSYGYVYPPYYGYGYGYTPPAYVAPDPPVYIERDPPAQPAAPVWWYWCADAKAYYPYVKECPGGWQRVPPQPPAEKQ